MDLFVCLFACWFVCLLACLLAVDEARVDLAEAYTTTWEVILKGELEFNDIFSRSAYAPGQCVEAGLCTDYNTGYRLRSDKEDRSRQSLDGGRNYKGKGHSHSAGTTMCTTNTDATCK